MNNLADGFLWYLAFIFSTVVHEAAHALAAYKLGDATAYHGGQVSLDPRPHIKREPMGTVVVPLVSFLAGGWMIGWASTPYNRNWSRMYPARSAWMSLAGPASNLILVVLAAALIHVGIQMDLFLPGQFSFSRIVVTNETGIVAGAAKLVSILFALNLLLCLFNLLPLPPLDGSGAIALLLNERKAVRYLDFIENPAFTFVGIFLAWQLFGRIFYPVFYFSVDLFFG